MCPIKPLCVALDVAHWVAALRLACLVAACCADTAIGIRIISCLSEYNSVRCTVCAMESCDAVSADTVADRNS